LAFVIVLSKNGIVQSCAKKEVVEVNKRPIEEIDSGVAANDAQNETESIMTPVTP